MNKPVKELKSSTKSSVRFLTSILIITGLLLVTLAINDNRAAKAIDNLKEHYAQIEKLRVEIIHLDELKDMAALMAGETKSAVWEYRYHQYKGQLDVAIEKAIKLAPQIYRSNNVEVIERLNVLLKKQIEAALEVERSKEWFSRMAFLSVLVGLLLSWLLMLGIARRSQEALAHSYEELNALNRTLDDKVKERTRKLATALEQLQMTHEDLKTAQMQLLQSEKFSAVGQLAAGIAHEINNPIGFIHSNLQTLEQYLVHYAQLLGILNKLEKALKDKDQERVAEIVLSWQKIRQETNFEFIDADISNLLKESRTGTEKVSKIVIDLREFASPDKEQTENVDLRALIESMLNIAWNEIKYKAELKKYYEDIPYITCNPQKIGQVIVNLLINAAHAIENKGTIIVRTYVKEGLVCFDVSDTGGGISPENMTKIFDPFFTTKAQGRGLGLSISYDIVRKHGGSMTFSSRWGHGTTFTVMLPEAGAKGAGV